MKKVMPQEIEVWYLIPALRKELAKIFIKNYKMNQKNAAEILGITEAAISQYVNEKRGNEMIFSKKDIERIKKSAEKILGNREIVMKEVYDLCTDLKKTKAVCGIHMNQDGSVPKNCNICFE